MIRSHPGGLFRTAAKAGSLAMRLCYSGTPAARLAEAVRRWAAAWRSHQPGQRLVECASRPSWWSARSSRWESSGWLPPCGWSPGIAPPSPRPPRKRSFAAVDTRYRRRASMHSISPASPHSGRGRRPTFSNKPDSAASARRTSPTKYVFPSFSRSSAQGLVFQGLRADCGTTMFTSATGCTLLPRKQPIECLVGATGFWMGCGHVADGFVSGRLQAHYKAPE